MANNMDQCRLPSAVADFDNCAKKMVELFNGIGDAQKMECLDILQHLVNSVMNTISGGRMQGVKFVPIEASETPAPSSWSETESVSSTEVTIKKEELEVSATDSSAWVTNGPIPVSLVTSSGVPVTTVLSCTSSHSVKKSHGRLSPRVVLRQDPFIDLLVKLNKDNEEGTKLINSNQHGDEPEIPLEVLGSVGKFSPRVLPFVPHLHDGPPTPPKPEVIELIKNCMEEPEEKKEEEEKKKQGLKITKKKKLKKQFRGKFDCIKCPYRTDKKFLMEAHSICHTKDRRFECKQCNKVFSAVSTLKLHLMKHEDLRPFQCPVCSKSFITKADLRSHSVVHTGERRFKCDLCDKVYTNSGNLSRHQRVHTGEMPYVCKVEGCSAKFRDLSSLKLHNLKHTGERPHSCGICNKTFRTSSDLIRHYRKHTRERLYTCQLCGDKFMQLAALKAHMSKHPNHKTWPCALCHKIYRTQSGYVQHQKDHRGEKNHACTVCNKAFSTRTTLRQHQITHTEDKPFSCRTCGKPFNQRANMIRHERMHVASYRYICKDCGLGFRYINSWRYHERSHTADKVRCEHCSYQYSSPESYKRHICHGHIAPLQDPGYNAIQEDMLTVINPDLVDSPQASTRQSSMSPMTPPMRTKVQTPTLTPLPKYRGRGPVGVKKEPKLTVKNTGVTAEPPYLQDVQYDENEDEELDDSKLALLEKLEAMDRQELINKPKTASKRPVKKDGVKNSTSPKIKTPHEVAIARRVGKKQENTVGASASGKQKPKAKKSNIAKEKLTVSTKFLSKGKVSKQGRNPSVISKPKSRKIKSKNNHSQADADADYSMYNHPIIIERDIAEYGVVTEDIMFNGGLVPLNSLPTSLAAQFGSHETKLVSADAYSGHCQTMGT